MSIISFSLPTELLEELDAILGEEKKATDQRCSGKPSETT